MDIIADKVKEAGNCIEQLLIMSNHYKSNLKVIERFKGTPYKMGQIIIRWIPVMFIIFIAVFIIAFCRLVYKYPTDPPDPRYVILNELLIPPIISLVITAIFYFPIALFLGRRSEKGDLEKAIKRSDELIGKIKEILHEKEDIINMIPQKYRYPLAVKFFAEVLENGRADSMKEAMNLFEEQLHRWKMENKMDQILKNQQIESTALWTYIITNSLFR